ncbi:unnamed protein product [Absidia cylindrospora]
MVIEPIPYVTIPTVHTRSIDIMEIDNTTIASSASSDQQEPTDMLHALHHDEKELRILAVVLSLTGGLVLSFLLGVGIFVYWHWRAWRARRRKKYQKSKKLLSSIETDDIEISTSAQPSILSPIPTSSSSSSSLLSSLSSSYSLSHSQSSSLAIEAIGDNIISTRQGENTSEYSSISHVSPPNPATSSSITSTSSSASQRIPSSPTAATTSFVSTSLSGNFTPIPSNTSVHSENNPSASNLNISNESDISKHDMMNDSAICQPSPVIINQRTDCSFTSTSSANHHPASIIPPLLLNSTCTSAPTPTAPPAKECLDSPSPSSSIPLPSHDMSTESSFDPPDIPPPAYSPN